MPSMWKVFKRRTACGMQQGAIFTQLVTILTSPPTLSILLFFLDWLCPGAVLCGGQRFGALSVKMDVSLLKRAVLHNISSLFRMKPQDLALQSMFAKEICKIRTGDRRSFCFEGTMESAADTITGEVSPSGYTGLFFRFFWCVCTGVLKVKSNNCLCSWVGRNKLM